MILQRTALYPQMRLDVPDARAIEAFGQNDWQYFMKGILSSKSMIISGFDISNYQNIFTVPGVLLQTNNVALTHSEATTQAQGFYVSSGTEADVPVILNPLTTNFVELDLAAVNGSMDVRAFWDPGANGGAGGEFTDTVATVINLELNVLVNVSGFSTGRIPLYKIITDANRKVTSVTDCRPMFFRLGTGGTSPDPTNEYSFRNLPDQTHARLETPITATSPTATNAPFQGGDKNIRSLKEWMDVVMTQLKQGFALPYWYAKPGAPSTAGAYQNAAMNILSGGFWKHLGKSSPITATTSTTIKVQPGAAFTPTASTLKSDNVVYNYATYNSTSGSFSGVSPSPLGVLANGDFVLQGSFGHLQLVGGTTLVRLGQANSTLLAFSDIDLSTLPVLYVILSTDGSTVAYGMGDDGATPIKPQNVTALTTSSITANLGGNYVQAGGKLLIRGQEFTYGSYSSGTGVFLNVTPDPSGIVQVNDTIYQSTATNTGYYHTSSTANVPGTINGISEGVERTFWIAYYDGGNNIIIRDSELVPGEQVAVGDDTSAQLLAYVGSTGRADNFPVYGVGSITDGTNLTAAIKAAFNIIEKPIYDEIIVDSGGTGWPANTTLFLPVNSRSNNAPGQYSIGTGELLVYENGILMRPTYDYTEFTSNSIKLSRDVYAGSYIRFRVASIGGAGAAAGGGSAGLDLQGAYANGSAIVVASANPVVIDGPVGQKLLHVKGDVQIDGLLDPTGLELTPQAASPIPMGKVGFWVENSANRMIYSRTDGSHLAVGDILESFGGEIQYFAKTKSNTTGATIPAGAPVYLKTDGTIGLADADVEAAATFYGITLTSIASGSAGKVIYTGTIPGILSGLGLTSGTYLWLNNIPGGMSTNPPTTPGSHLRIIGIVDGNDLVLQPQHNGQVGS